VSGNKCIDFLKSKVVLSDEQRNIGDLLRPILRSAKKFFKFLG